MDIYEAIQKIERFLETYPEEHGGDPAPWRPVEVKLLPSGDENDTIKVWFNFGAEVSEPHVKTLLDQFEEAAHRDIPALRDFTLHIRGDAF